MGKNSTLSNDKLYEFESTTPETGSLDLSVSFMFCFKFRFVTIVLNERPKEIKILVFLLFLLIRNRQVH